MNKITAADVLASTAFLKANGYDTGTPDGFGPKWRAAMADFGEKCGLDEVAQVPSYSSVVGPEYPILVTVAGVHVCADRQAQTVFYESLLNVDSDGSPHSYSRIPGQGLDYLANAGHPGNWYGILTDAHGIPVIQGANDPAPGYYISTTSIVDPTYPQTDPRRYADSEKIAYLACAAQLFESCGVKIGDVATVFHGGKSVNAIVADTGNRTSLGEGSIYLARQLGLCADPKGSGDAPMPHDVRYVIHLGTAELLPGGKVGRLLAQDEIDARATAALATRNVDVTRYFV